MYKAFTFELQVNGINPRYNSALCNNNVKGTVIDVIDVIYVIDLLCVHYCTRTKLPQRAVILKQALVI